MAVSADIKETYLSIPADSEGWSLEVNLVSWNGRDPKYDIRKWNSDHTSLSKGLTLSEDEIVIMFQHYKEVLEKITGEEIKDEEKSV